MELMPVDLRRIIKPNMRLVVVDQVTGCRYKCTIQEISPEYIAISVPVCDPDTRLPKDSAMLRFLLQSSDAVIAFSGAISGSRTDDRVPMYLVAWPRSFERYQRREYFRQPCIFDARYWVLPASVREVPTINQDLALELGEPQKGTVVDLSGGGLRLASKAKHEPHDLLAICLQLQNRKEKKEIWVLGRVMRRFSPVQDRQQINHYAVSFCENQEKVKEAIIRFIFTLMRGKIR